MKDKSLVFCIVIAVLAMVFALYKTFTRPRPVERDLNACAVESVVQDANMKGVPRILYRCADGTKHVK